MGCVAWMLLNVLGFVAPQWPSAIKVNPILRKLSATTRSAPLLVLIVVLLSGCAGEEVVRGRFDYDLRPLASRHAVNWPAPPDTPRFRYVGELLGEPNFVDMSDQSASLLARSAMLVGKWVAGLLSVNEKLLLHRPMHGTSDAAGRVFVVDAGRNAILVFEPQAAEGKKGEGELLVWTQAEEWLPFQSPIAIAFAWKGRLAVSDAKLKSVYLLDGKGVPVGKLGAGLLERPTGLAFDASRGQLYVADTEASNVKVFGEDGRLLRTIGKPGSGLGEFNAPTHLAFSADRLYVSDALNNRIQVFGPQGDFLRATGATGVHVGQLTRPKGVAFNADSKLTYVVESYFAHLLIYDEQGQFLLGIDGSGLPQGKFMLPAGVWLGAGGKVFVADMYNNRVVVFEYLAAKSN